jgi:quinol-cytochrome oxidoreductase complex cytochrome b subunit
MNAAGIGSFFNLLNFGQMYSYHVLLLPAAVVAVVIAHILLVRRHGVVPPFDLERMAVKSAPEAQAIEPDREAVP